MTSKRVRFTKHNPHDSNKVPIQNGKNIFIVSIDPGVKNCGIYIGMMNTETNEHKTIFLDCLRFASGKEGRYKRILKKLDEFKHIFERMHYVVIEEQVKPNYTAIKMAHFLIGYFMGLFRSLDTKTKPVVIELSSKAKTRILDAPPNMTYPQRKKWCWEKACLFLSSRKNKEYEMPFLSHLTTSKKNDDMGDAICQCYAWIKMMSDSETTVGSVE